MTKEYTYAFLKKRIIKELSEYDEAFCEDERLSERMPTAINSSLIRMYESLPVSHKECLLKIENSDEKGYFNVNLPDDCMKVLSIGLYDGRNIFAFCRVCENVVMIPSWFCHGADSVLILYKMFPPEIDEKTTDDFVFRMSPIAFEALIYLCASELCRQGESELYSKLLYKYRDLSESFFSCSENAVSRNGFYRASLRKRCF